MRRLGLALLIVGFLGGAFFATRERHGIAWAPFGASAALMFAGLLLVHRARRAGQADVERHAADVARLRGSLARAVQGLAELLAARRDLFVYDVHGLLDERLRESLLTFAENRKAMIPLYGLEAYADVMTAFAAAERLIHRAWSASADGYVDEVWRSLELAHAEMCRARDRLETLSRS